MFSYVYNEGKWVETNKLYPHDVALLLNPEEKKIYIWEGPRATLVLKAEAAPYIEDLQRRFEGFQYETLTDIIPAEIEAEIKNRLDFSYETMSKIEREPQYVLFLVFGLLAVVSMFVSYSFVFGPGMWDRSSLNPALITIPIPTFEFWVKWTQIPLIITASLFGLMLISSIFTKKIFLIMTGLAALLIELGTLRYVSLGVYLFDFQSGSAYGTYDILVSDVLGYIFLNIFAVVSIIVPLIISFVAIFRDTVPISFSDWKAKRNSTKINLRKFSVVSRQSHFITQDAIRDPSNLLKPEEITAQQQDISIALKMISDE